MFSWTWSQTTSLHQITKYDKTQLKITNKSQEVSVDDHNAAVNTRESMSLKLKTITKLYTFRKRCN